MPIQYWLLKTEPSVYAFEDLLERRREVWDGITNPLALRNLRAARRGDLALIYHTGTMRAAVGIARVLGEAYPDPKQNDPKRMVVEIEPVRALKRPVSLDEIKRSPVFKGCDLLRLPRLSFVPLAREHWDHLLRISDSRP
jgi:predicted RNA-binding protein with PUA-like domain